MSTTPATFDKKDALLSLGSIMERHAKRLPVTFLESKKCAVGFNFYQRMRLLDALDSKVAGWPNCTVSARDGQILKDLRMGKRWRDYAA